MGIAALSTEHVVISAKRLEDWTGTEAVECIMNYGLRVATFQIWILLSMQHAVFTSC